MPVEQRNTVTFKCDNPGCSTTIMWVQQEVQQKPEALPDAAWRVVNVSLFDGSVRGFCSKYCVLEYFRTYVPLKSPREIAEQAQAEKELAEKAAAALKPGVVGLPPGIELNPTNQPKKVIEFPGTVPDATGNSGEGEYA